MGRRNLHSKEALKELILQATQDIITTEGFKSVTARKIAAQIGYTAGTLYHIFESLDDIFIHIKSRALDRFENYFDETFSKKAFTVESFMEFYLTYSLEIEKDWSLLSEKHLEKSELPSWYLDKVQALFIKITTLSSQSLKINSKKASLLTKMMWSGAHGLGILSMDKKLEILGQTDYEELKKEFVQFFNNQLAIYQKTDEAALA